jgi:Protein of unknown function (DUF4012)
MDEWQRPVSRRDPSRDESDADQLQGAPGERDNARREIRPSQPNRPAPLSSRLAQRGSGAVGGSGADPDREGLAPSWRKLDPSSGDWVDPRAPAPRSEPVETPPPPTPRPAARRPPSAPKGPAGLPAEKGGGLLSRFRGAEAAASQAWGALTGHPRQQPEATGAKRKPTSADWRASDYDPHELDAMLDSDQHDAYERADQDSRAYRRAGRDRTSDRYDPRDRDDRYKRDQTGERRRASRRDDFEFADGSDWDANWETGTWDTGWAQAPGGGWGDDDGWGGGNGGDWGDDGGWDAGEYADDNWSRSLVALGASGMAELPMGRIARVRMVLRERPGAGVMLIVFLIAFALTCIAPLLPLLRLGYDVADAAHRVSTLQKMVATDGTGLIQPAKLAEVQTQVTGIEHDVYEINSATNILGAPLSALSPALRNYRLLMRMGYDLTAAADEGLQVAQTLVVPLQGGALAASTSSPGITPADIAQARGVIADAQSRVADAVAAYQQLTPSALPSQLRPGSKYGQLLALLPSSVTAFNELNTLLNIAPAMLGVGQPAAYLVIAMDRTELRPGGGFQGNYGILSLVGGKQQGSSALSLNDTYTAMDEPYYLASLPTAAAKATAQQNCASTNAPTLTQDYYGPEPPADYWWWPYRNFSWCWNWGLRDSNLSADFPTNARNAMAIVQNTPGRVPGNAPLQGVIAFTPEMIADVLKVTGPISLPQYPKDPPVTADNLEFEIHCHQLWDPHPQCLADEAAAGTNRKLFTHLLSVALLAKIKTLHGTALKDVVKAAVDALKTKDLQIYFADPRAELILQQLGFASQMSRGNQDGFFVVDTNIGGNKANLYVSETQQDLVTLLPDGGAIHRLQVTVTYAYPKGGWVYADWKTTPEDYNDVQRVYMPGDATLLGNSGYVNLPSGSQWQNAFYPQPISDCGSDGGADCLNGPVTLSDTAGRTMVIGHVDVSCHDDANGNPMWGLVPQPNGTGLPACNQDPTTNHQTINVEWYTPNAWTPTSNGHGAYSELVQKQAGTETSQGSVNHVTVYLDTSQLHSAQKSVDWTNPDLRASALQHATKIYDQPLEADTTVSYSW